MKRHLLLGAAVAAMFANHSFAQVVLDENFDDGLGASRFTVNTIQRPENAAATPPVLNGTTPSANFNFNYGAYNYDAYAFPSSTLTTQPIPAAPGSATTIGLRVANTPNGVAGALNASSNLAILPNAVNVSGDFRIEGYVWENYNGAPGNYINTQGGTGSTEGVQIGLNRAGTAGVAGYLPTGATRANGYGFVITNEGGNANDYQMYSNDTGDDGASYAKRNGAWQGAVRQNRIAFDGTGNLLVTAFPDTPGNNTASYYRDEVFTSADGYEIPGAPAKKWTKFVMEQRGNIATMQMNGKIMMTLFNSAAFSGTPQFGYVDVNNGSIPSPADSNFSIYDNLKVTQLTAAPVNSVTSDTNAVFNASGSVAGATLRGLHISGAAGVTLTGNMTMSGEGSSIYAPAGVNAIPGTLTLASDTAIVVGNTSAGVPATAIPPNGSTLTIGSIVANAGSNIVKTGMGTLNVPYIRADALTLVDGRINFTGAGPSNATRVKAWAQEYQGNVVKPVPSPAPTNIGVCLLDIGKTVMQIDYVPRINPLDPTQNNSPLSLLVGKADLFGTLETGFGNGTWNGTRGITSSAMATAPVDYTIRIAEASTLGFTDGGTWGATGLPIDASAVVFGYTNVADTNLDQSVDFDDLLKLAQFYDTSYDPIAEGVKWYNGDSNSDGFINFDDLLKLAQVYGSVVSLVGTDVDVDLHNSFDAHWALARSIVPEPTSLTALAMGGLMLRRRR